MGDTTTFRSLAIPEQRAPLTRELVARAFAIDALLDLYCDDAEGDSGRLEKRMTKLDQFAREQSAAMHFVAELSLPQTVLLIKQEPPLEAFVAFMHAFDPYNLGPTFTQQCNDFDFLFIQYHTDGFAPTVDDFEPVRYEFQDLSLLQRAVYLRIFNVRNDLAVLLIGDAMKRYKLTNVFSIMLFNSSTDSHNDYTQYSIGKTAFESIAVATLTHLKLKNVILTPAAMEFAPDTTLSEITFNECTFDETSEKEVLETMTRTCDDVWWQFRHCTFSQKFYKTILVPVSFRNGVYFYAAKLV